MRRLILVLAAFLVFGCAQQELPQASRTSPPFLEGSLPQRDLAEIMRVVGHSRDVQEKVIFVHVKSPTSVEVYTGKWDGPQQGGGHIVGVQKRNGQWVIVPSDGYRFWVI
jgi:hypothetical protein